MFSKKIGQKAGENRVIKRIRIVQSEPDENENQKMELPIRASFQQTNLKFIDTNFTSCIKHPVIQRKIPKINSIKPFQTFLRTEPDEPKPKDRDHGQGNKYDVEGVAGKGTFGVVYVGRVRGTGEKVAIKKVLQDKRYKNRELDLLKILKNQQVLEMRDFYILKQGEQEFLHIVMNYFPNNLYEVIKKKQITAILLKIVFYQILKGLNYLSALSIAHRDIKPQNILVDTSTSKALICDLGSAKKLVSGENNLSYICSRCYRAPELIFGAVDYTPQIDMWSAGCVLVEMINGNPPFLASSQLEQLVQIIKALGTPSREIVLEMNPKADLKQHAKFPNVGAISWTRILNTKDPLLIDLVARILQYSPKRRLKPSEAILHPYFDELRKEEHFQDLSLKHKSYYSWFEFSKQQLKMFKQPDLAVPRWLEHKAKNGIKRQCALFEFS